MESEFRSILEMVKKGQLNPPTGASGGLTAPTPSNDVIIVKKKGNLFKILKYVIIVAVVITIGGILYMCIKRVKNSQDTVVPYTPIKLDDVDVNIEDYEDDDAESPKGDEKEDESYKDDDKFTLLEDLPSE